MGISSQAQVDLDRRYWVFGRNSLLGFDKGGVTTIGTQPMDATNGSACYSNKNGALVFSVGAYGLYNHITEQQITVPIKALDAIIIPKNSEETLFYIIAINRNGEVRVAEYNTETNAYVLDSRVLLMNSAQHLTAVKHCFLDAYWLITSDVEDKFHTFLVKPDEISEGVVSQTGGFRTITGDMRSSFDGTMLAVSNYTESWVELYGVDKSCGNISFIRRLGKLDPDDDRPLSVCFAPNDKSLYVAWGYQQSRVTQYPIDAPGTIYHAFSYPQNINSLEIAYDDKMYIGVHENGNLSRRIHAIANPNSISGGNRVTLDAIQAANFTNIGWEFPNFIQNHTGGYCNGQTALWTALGEEYYICDLEKETTVLDAGKGFKKYKWTPTGDTTQWIIVSDLGEYIVIVDAFNGCQGEDRTVVKRRCDLEYHIPNAFTPNADGRNDLFRVNGENIESATLHIYNRWGEKFFEGSEWDGNNAQNGVYFYTVTIKGFVKKVAATYNETGTIHLLR